MQITTATIQALQTTVRKEYRSAFDKTPIWNPQLCTTLPSNTRIGTYAWQDTIAAMREWLGPRTLANITNTDYQLTNRDWERTISADRRDVEDDLLGIFSQKVMMLGETAKKLVDQRTAQIIQDGDTVGLCFDGLSFFNNAHTLDPAGTQDNNFAGTALTLANYAAVRAAMRAFTDSDGQPLNVNPGLLVVPPQLEGAGRTIINAELVPSAAATATESNVWRNTAELLVVPELANEATTWYLMDVSKPIKPFIWQNRKSPELVSMTAPTDEAVFTTRQYRWGVDARGASGYSLWFLASRAIA